MKISAYLILYIVMVNETLIFTSSISPQINTNNNPKRNTHD